MIEPGAAGKSGAGVVFPRGALAPGHLGTAPPRGFPHLRLSSVPSRRPSGRPGDARRAAGAWAQYPAPLWGWATNTTRGLVRRDASSSSLRRLWEGGGRVAGGQLSTNP